jgi:hypothetical protein
VYNYSGVDRDGITSFAASEDLERVVKVIDIALKYATTTTRPTYCWGLDGSTTQHEATKAAQRQPDLDGTRSEARQSG